MGFRVRKETVTVKVCILLVKKKNNKKKTTIEMHKNYKLHLDHLDQRPTRTKKNPKK